MVFQINKKENQMNIVAVKGLSDTLSVKQSTIYMWVEQKRVPHFRIGKKILFDSDEVLKWLIAHKREPNAIYRIRKTPGL